VSVRRALVCALVLAICSFVAPARARAVVADRGWVRPVDGRVVRTFAPPQTRYGRGHLGVDFAATSLTPVSAAGPGVVTFAGAVGDTLHVVVAHDGGLRTSYSFLQSIRVRRGDRVDGGTVVGFSGGHGPEHDGSELHFGLRHGAEYVDPMLLFAPPDLSQIVHLAPAHDAPQLESTDEERRGVIDGLRGLLDAGVHAGGVVLHGGSALAHSALAHSTLAHSALAPMFHLPFPGRTTITGVTNSLRDWMQQRRNCNPHAPAADGTGGSGHRVMVVAGIDSATNADGASLDVPLDKLGYAGSEVTYFSYARDGGTYTKSDTHAALLDSARRLGAQLQAMQRKEPGREVDLIAHSQGGVVVLAFLAFVYDSGNPAYPPLGTVVTLSSPLEGAPLATAAERIARSRSGRTFLATVDQVAASTRAPLPPSRSPSVRDLAADSDFMRRLDAAPIPPMVDLTPVGAVADPVVPAVTATRHGHSQTVVAGSPFPWSAHTAIEHDRGALRVLRAALEHRPVPCESLPTALATALVSPGIVDLEHDSGVLAGWAAKLADLDR
jgi:Peptidase family M23